MNYSRSITARRSVNPDAFATSTDTVYFAAAAHEQQLLAPLVVGLISELRDAAYRRHAELGTGGLPLLLLLDECANIAPVGSARDALRRRWSGRTDARSASGHESGPPALAARSRRHTLAVRRQGRHGRCCRRTDTRAAIAHLRRLGPPSTDDHQQHSPVFSGKSSTTSEAWTTRRERRLPPDQIAQLHRGQALVIVRSSWRILPAIPTNVTPPRPPRDPQRPGKRSMSTTLSPGFLPATPGRPAAGLHQAATGGEGKGAKRPRQPRGRCHHPPGPGRRTTTRPSSTSSATRAKRASSSERTASCPNLPRRLFPTPPCSTEALLTADDDADILGVPRMFVYALARRGELPTVRIGDRYVRLRSRDAPTLDRAARDDGSTRHAVTG